DSLIRLSIRLFQERAIATFHPLVFRINFHCDFSFCAFSIAFTDLSKSVLSAQSNKSRCEAPPESSFRGLVLDTIRFNLGCLACFFGFPHSAAIRWEAALFI